MKYNDRITIIRRNGTGRHGKIPDNLVDVLFVKLHDTSGVFLYRYPDDSVRRIHQALISDIITVNNEPT